MAYVDVNAPLPRNSMSPPDPAEIACGNAARASIERMVSDGRAASLMVANPQSFAMLGQGVVNDVARSQKELVSTKAITVNPVRQKAVDALMSAPQIVPLNVPEEEINCRTRGVKALLPVTNYDPDMLRVKMPPMAPTDTQLLTPGRSRFVPLMRPAIAQNPGLSGVPWGDAIAMATPQPAISWKGLLFLALGGLGLYAVTGKGRR
jgi:hypothetical protein